VVYTLPAELRDLAYQNKPVIYDLLMKASAETTLTIAADPEHLGARIGIIAVLHTWGSESPRAHDRARWRFIRGWLAMDLQPSGLPRARQRLVAPIQRTVLDDADLPTPKAV
jgi:hypothetical protein